MGDEFSLFTALRYDPQLIQVSEHGPEYAGWNHKNQSPLYMLDFHRDRMLRAAAHWNWQAAIDTLAGETGLHRLCRLSREAVGPSQDGPLRLRILITYDGEVIVEKYNTYALPIANLFPKRLPAPGSAIEEGDPKKEPHYALLVDNTQTARSEYTHFKTTKRTMYDSARDRAKIAPTDKLEVLIVHKEDGSVMEGSTTTPYFWRDGRWVTPPVAAKFSWQDGSGGQDGTSRRWVLER